MCKTGRKIVLILLINFLIASPLAASDLFGKFLGEVVSQYSSDGESIELLKDLAFEDSSGKAWVAKKGLKTDGASIPRIFWTIFGSPLRGKYIKAAIVHDQYCVTRIEPWKKVHRMFYSALRASDVSFVDAKIMYAAVYVGGPRWDRNTMESSRRFFMASQTRALPLEEQMLAYAHPPRKMFIEGTELYELCVSDSCSWSDLSNYQEQWAANFLDQHKTVDLRMRIISVEQRNSIVEHLRNNDLDLDEVDKYLEEVVGKSEKTPRIWSPLPGFKMDWENN